MATFAQLLSQYSQAAVSFAHHLVDAAAHGINSLSSNITTMNGAGPIKEKANKDEFDAYKADNAIYVTNTVGVDKTGIADSTTALQVLLSSLSDGDTIYFPYGTYKISKEITISKKIKIKADNAVLKFATVFDDSGSNTLGMIYITADNVEIDGIEFYGADTTNKSLNNRFVWIDSSNVKISNCIFKSLPKGGSNFNGAIGFSITSSQGEVSNCRFYNNPGSVFVKAPRTRIINCISEYPSDVSYALNGEVCVGSSVIGCKVYAPNLSCAIHIGVEEGASDSIIQGNYIYGIKDGIGIGFINIVVTETVNGGIISNNIIDGGSYVTTNPCAFIKVSKYYKNVIIDGNTMRNAPTGNANNVCVSLEPSDIIFSKNIIDKNTDVGFCIYVRPGTGDLIIADNPIINGGGGSRCVFVINGDFGNKKIISKNNCYRNATEGLSFATATNLQFYMENDNFVGVANEVNSGKGYDSYFNTYNAYEYPYKITRTRYIYGNAAPTGGAWSQGDTIVNYAPVSGGVEGWKCVVPGTPGTWKAYGSIS